MTNELLLQNIETLRKERGFNKMGDFETNTINVSVGYFSRLGKTPENFPAMDVLLKLSETFGVSIDTLVKTDIRAMGRNSRLIQEFVEKLKTETLQGNMKWEEIQTIQTLHKIKYKRKINCPYKVFINHNPIASTYGGKNVYLQRLIFEGKDDKGQDISGVGYEISMTSSTGRDEKNTIICYSDMVIDIIRESIFELAKYIGRDLQDSPMEDDAIEAIQDFLKM